MVQSEQLGPLGLGRGKAGLVLGRDFRLFAFQSGTGPPDKAKKRVTARSRKANHAIFSLASLLSDANPKKNRTAAITRRVPFKGFSLDLGDPGCFPGSNA